VLGVDTFLNLRLCLFKNYLQVAGNTELFTHLFDGLNLLQ
jgi:hypothetical protein